MPTSEKSIAAAPDDYRRTNAVLIALPALLALILVMHHPVLHFGHDAGADHVAAAVGAVAGMNAFVHAGLLLALCVQATGFFGFAARLGLARPLVAGGMLFVTLSAGLMFIPALLDGFVTGALAARCLGTANCETWLLTSFALVAAMIQAFTKAALAMQALGLFAWSLAIAGGAGRARIVGIAAAIVALLPLLLLAATLGPQQLTRILVLIDLWTLGAAIALFVGAPAMFGAERHGA